MSCVKFVTVCSLQIVEGGPPTYPLPTRAVFRYAPSRDTAVAQDICLQSGVLDQATVSVYINGTFTWRVSAQPFSLMYSKDFMCGASPHGPCLCCRI